jgi:hypothetical protein
MPGSIKGMQYLDSRGAISLSRRSVLHSVAKMAEVSLLQPLVLLGHRQPSIPASKKHETPANRSSFREPEDIRGRVGCSIFLVCLTTISGHALFLESNEWATINDKLGSMYREGAVAYFKLFFLLLLYQFTRRVTELTVVVIVGYYCYQLHTKLYPIFFSIRDHQCGF